MPLLGDYTLEHERFKNLDHIIGSLSSQKEASEQAKLRLINETLLDLIESGAEEAFLLPAVLEYIAKVNDHALLQEPYHFYQFEFWMNQTNELDEEKQAKIRGKIAGKYIPREDYQALFPIGMGKTFFGSHFIAAHRSPDIDTMIASFWGWVDAFAARVGTAQHIWNLPGNPPESPVTRLFQQMFDQKIFSCLARQTPSLTLYAQDVLSKENLRFHTGETPISHLDHGSGERAMVLVDREGRYLGDWHTVDGERIRQVTMLVKACLHWLENTLNVKLVTAFAKETLTAPDIPAMMQELFETPISQIDPVSEFDSTQKKWLNLFFQKILHLDEESDATFNAINEALKEKGLMALDSLKNVVSDLDGSSLFDQSGKLVENRPKIFTWLKETVKQINQTVLKVRSLLDRLDVAIQIKHEIFESKPAYLTPRSDVEEIRVKMKNLHYMVVNAPDYPQGLVPTGVVWAHDVRMPALGTVSFRDFSNPEETRMASYLNLISVIDHHKSSIQTSSPPSALIGDAQSANILVAEQAMRINSRYSMGGASETAISDEIASLGKENPKIMRRLLRKQMIAAEKGGYYIHPQREFAEYLTFIYAILDDTDLLTKVSNRDIQCVVDLLNRMKTIATGKESEVVSVDHIPKDRRFANRAAKEILQNEEMYSLYSKIYQYKEQEINDALEKAEAGDLKTLFMDTKEQNGCARIGQIKLFSSNITAFKENVETLRGYWYEQAVKIHENEPELDLHILMVSTIPTAEEVYEDKVGNYSHKDQLWFWIPSTQTAYDHFSNFLNGFKNAPELKENEPEWELLGANREELKELIEQNFLSSKIKGGEGEGLPLAVMKFNAGTLNSRKSMISPYLPRLVS